ncbi:MAG: tetratricopeptide repeat protein, partial [Gemmatimonadetes bacterium]|nr:tetratricopeptide repeat protein [Gemmatimonadota bacterium]
MTWSRICILYALLCILSLEQAAADQRDSLLTLGQKYLREGQAEAAVATFSDLTKAFPKDAHIQSRLGYAYLKNRDFEKAETAFKTAKGLDKNLAEAYVGLGLVYAERPASGLSAYSNFRKAVGEAKRATKLDSTYGPAYRLLGELYERFQEDHQKAVDYYLKYIQVESDNPDGLYYFGLACVQADQHDQIAAHIIPYINAHDPELRLLPLAAAGYFHQKEHRLALNPGEG